MPDLVNPFEPELTERLAYRFPPRQSWETLMAKLAEQKNVGAIVGGAGSGKTTVLMQLIPHLKAAGYEPKLFRLSSEGSMKERERLAEALRPVQAPGFILLDGAEQLSTRLWLPVRAAASAAAGFIVTVHRVSRLPTLLECETSPALLRELVVELAGEEISPDDAADLLLRHRGSIRASLAELYQWWEERAARSEE